MRWGKLPNAPTKFLNTPSHALSQNGFFFNTWSGIRISLRASNNRNAILPPIYERIQLKPEQNFVWANSKWVDTTWEIFNRTAWDFKRRQTLKCERFPTGLLEILRGGKLLNLTPWLGEPRGQAKTSCCFIPKELMWKDSKNIYISIPQMMSQPNNIAMLNVGYINKSNLVIF